MSHLWNPFPDSWSVGPACESTGAWAACPSPEAAGPMSVLKFWGPFSQWGPPAPALAPRFTLCRSRPEC